MSLLKLTASTVAIAAISAGAASARDQIMIVGSSTVFPYTQAVAEEFANRGGVAPVAESTGTGGGMKVFCGGVGEGHPDVTGASRAMKLSEFELCTGNGVTDITEGLIGYDGLAMAVSRKNDFDWNLSLQHIYMALAAKVPVGGALADNPYKKWSDIDASLPATDIVAYGPPPTSGTRDAFVELAMHVGCLETEFALALKETASEEDFEKFVEEDCSRMRQDGPFVEAGENDNLIVKKLEADPKSLGIFGFSFLEENAAQLQGSVINGNEPTFENIADGKYTVARPLFVYIKKQHIGVIPGLDKFMAEYVSDKAIGDEGYLSDKGLVTLPAAMLEEVRAGVAAATTLTGEGL